MVVLRGVGSGSYCNQWRVLEIGRIDVCIKTNNSPGNSGASLISEVISTRFVISVQFQFLSVSNLCQDPLGKRQEKLREYSGFIILQNWKFGQLNHFLNAENLVCLTVSCVCFSDMSPSFLSTSFFSQTIRYLGSFCTSSALAIFPRKASFLQ